MISNGEIRRKVTERIKHDRLKLFGYTLIYSMIIGTGGAILSFIVSLIAAILAALISLPLGALFSLNTDNTRAIINLITQSCSSIATIFITILTFVLSIGFMKEIILSMVPNDNKISPIDFLKLGFNDYKRLIKVYLRLFLKSLPGAILIIVGYFICAIGLLMSGAEIVAILISLFGGLVILAGIIWTIAILILYQTVAYELIYDEQGLSAKEILVKSRETLKGHTWQWTRMNYYYAFIAFIIVFFVTLLFVSTFGLSAYIISNAGNAAAVFGVLFMIFAVLIFAVTIAVVSFLLQYFTSKNILNLDELYKEIQSEKRGDVSPV